MSDVPITLEPGDVHVWCRPPTRSATPTSRTPWRVLSPDERTRYARFRFARDQRDYAAAHALLRTSLSRYADVAPGRGGFTRAPGGKPSLVPDDGSAAALVQPVPHARSRRLRHRRRAGCRHRRGVGGPRRRRRHRRAVFLRARERRPSTVCVGAAAGASLLRFLDVEGGVRQGDRQGPVAPAGHDCVRRRRRRLDICSARRRASTPQLAVRALRADARSTAWRSRCGTTRTRLADPAHAPKQASD